MIITSKENKIFKYVKKLSDKKFRDEFGVFIVEGTRAVADVSAYCPDSIESILIMESKATNESEKEIAIADNLFHNLSETINSQGVLAIVKKPKQTPSGSKFSLFLDGIKDPGNLGTLIRTACAAGFCDIYLRNCTDPYSGKVVRSTMSAIVKVNIANSDLNTLVNLKSEGYILLGADMGGKPLFGYDSPEKVCLIVGSEACGITPEVKELCDDLISIPMDAKIESLNAAVSGAIMMYNLKYNK